MLADPRPSETELLEAVADIQRTLTEVTEKLGEIAQNAETAKTGNAPASSPPSTAAPMQMGRDPISPPATATRAEPPQPDAAAADPIRGTKEALQLQ